MPTSQETMDIKKAMAYDLILLLEEKDGEYTADEIKKIIQAYIAGLNQQK